MRDLEQRLSQGKLSFASPERLKKYLGVEPGSVSPFGIINDINHHVHLFIDKKLTDYKRLSFHPNINTASIIISRTDLMKFVEYQSNNYDILELYND